MFKKEFLLGLFGYVFLRLLGSTWRYRIEDHAGLTLPNAPRQPLIWLIWHNRLLAMPTFWHRHFRHRKSSVLVSRSKDGEIISRIIHLFGSTTVRGSSSRGGANALGALSRALAAQRDVYITPDGPRGPKYSMHSGALWLSQSTRTPIMPVSIEVSRSWRLQSWDQFFVPKPFARIVITLHEPLPVQETTGEDEMAREREVLRGRMLEHTVEL